MNNNLSNIDLNAELDDMFKDVDVVDNSPEPESRIEHSEPIALVKDKRCSVNYDDVFNDPDYLAHHGILGMHWGDRNGPPYPLGSGGGSGRSAEEKRKTGSKVSKSGIQKRKNKISDSVEKTVKKYTGADKKEESKKTGRGSGGGSGSSGGKSHYKSVDDARKELKSKDGESKILAKWDSLSDEDKKKVYVAAGIVTTAVICGAAVGVHGYKNYSRLTEKYIEESMEHYSHDIDFDPLHHSLIKVVNEADPGQVDFVDDLKDTLTRDTHKMYALDANIHNAPTEMSDEMADALAKTNPLMNSNVKVDEDTVLAKIGYLDPEASYTIRNQSGNIFEKSKAGLQAEIAERRTDTGIPIVDAKFGASGYDTMRAQEGAYIFNNNCPHTTWTYEMRRRGEDVVAMPGTGVILNNDPSLVASRYFELKPDAVKTYKFKEPECAGRTDLEMLAINDEHFAKMAPTKTLTEQLSPQIIKQYNSEIGARGQLLVPGHSMNWEIIGVRDPKTNEVVPTVAYTCAQLNITPEQGVSFMNQTLPKRVPYQDFEISTIRLDNARVYTTRMNEFCTNGYKKTDNGEIIVPTKSIMSHNESLMRDDATKPMANKKLVEDREFEAKVTQPKEYLNQIKDPPPLSKQEPTTIKTEPTMSKKDTTKKSASQMIEELLSTVDDVDDYFLN